MRILGTKNFEEFDGFFSTGEKECLSIEFSDNTLLECSINHGLYMEDNTWITAKELLPNDILKNNKKIKAITSTGIKPTYSPGNVGTDFSYYSNGVINHNCAFIEGYDEFFASVYPTISSGESTKVMMTSTPNGLNHFWKTCKGAEEQTNGYEYTKVMWYDVPGRDEKWKQETLQALDFDEEKFRQEFCCSFLGSSGTLIDGSKLKELSYSRPLVEVDGLTQYKAAQEGNSYVMTVDVSRGKGLDYSTFNIIDVTKMPYKQVCTYRNNVISPVDFSSVIYRIGLMYNECAVLIEINDIGEQVSDTLLMDYGYENLLYSENAGRSGKRITAGFGKRADNGIRTTKSVKSIGCSILKMLIEQNQLLLVDYNTIQELSRFSKKGTSYEAEKGSHDDLVMNLVIFAWLTDQAFFKDLTDINTLMKLRQKTEEQIEEELLPFGFIDTGEDLPDESDFMAVREGWQI